ncbi:hypothetical protein EHRUM4_06620 [Ehrlichia ruminantium]|uniref:DUF3023 domain-containing protein n=1 Tax=Ehrlichia ruminantium TaxID=779 RepID=A0A170QUM6_EHRRU|nr:DUF3023 domain-containing protein [Ehrlichia ruminantium]GAT75442.1 hypothetical protein EHRUM4_06620 [Ehrlichia ruminantium]GAT78555.1 hypothetical protein EHRUM3_07810 [Ehrlichia ruminantium]
MLFKPGLPISKITESLHRSVIRELNRSPEIHVNTCHCIGATINGKTLDVWVDDRPGNRCIPVGISLFRMECIIPSAVINHQRNISLQKLIRILSNPFVATLEPLKADLYFIVLEEELKDFTGLIKPLSTTPPTTPLIIHNISRFGTFSLCRPKSIGNRNVSQDISFDEFTALHTLGGLEDSTFFKVPLQTHSVKEYSTEKSILGSKQQKVVATSRKNTMQLISKMLSRVSATQYSHLSTPVSAKMEHNIEGKTGGSTQKPTIQKVIVTSKQTHKKEKIQFTYKKFPEVPEHPSSNKTQEIAAQHLEQHPSKSIVGSAQFIQKGTIEPQPVVKPKTQFASSPFYTEQKHPSSNKTQEIAAQHLEQHPSKSIVGSPQFIQKGTIEPQQVVRPKTQFASSPFYTEQEIPTTKHQTLNVIEESTDSNVSINTSSSEDLRFLSVDYLSSCKVLYDTQKQSYKVDTLPTAPLVPSCQLEDDVFVEDSNPHVSLN